MQGIYPSTQLKFTVVQYNGDKAKLTANVDSIAAAKRTVRHSHDSHFGIITNGVRYSYIQGIGIRFNSAQPQNRTDPKLDITIPQSALPQETVPLLDIFV